MVSQTSERECIVCLGPHEESIHVATVRPREYALGWRQSRDEQDGHAGGRNHGRRSGRGGAQPLT